MPKQNELNEVEIALQVSYRYGPCECLCWSSTVKLRIIVAQYIPENLETNFLNQQLGCVNPMLYKIDVYRFGKHLEIRT